MNSTTRGHAREVGLHPGKGTAHLRDSRLRPLQRRAEGGHVRIHSGHTAPHGISVRLVKFALVSAIRLLDSRLSTLITMEVSKAMDYLIKNLATAGEVRMFHGLSELHASV